MKTLISSIVMLLHLWQPLFAQTLTFSPNHSVVLCGPTDVYFVCQSDQTVHNIWWDFGDGTTGSGTNPVHRYTSMGIYDVKMVVEINGVMDSVVKPAFVTLNPMPDDSFTVSSDPILIPYTRNFVFKGSTDSIVEYRWTVDGVLVSSNAKCKYTFPSNGIYQVSLEVTHQFGCINSRDLVVEINDKPLPQTGLSEQQQPIQCSFSELHNQLNISRTNHTAEPITIRLFDITGRLLNSYLMSASTLNYTIDLSSEVPTVLVVELSSQSFESVQKLHPRYL